LLEKYRGLAQEIDPARIRVIGRVAEGEDYLWIAASDITIQCGAVGLAINQSMAFGTPTVIADQIGPDTELLVDGQTGWRYPQGDLDALVATVAAVMGDDTTRQRITNQARCLVRDDVNIDNMVRNVDACIRAALVQYHSKAGH
jgi:glycosyltransferase involved in cell wall biosynthesis